MSIRCRCEQRGRCSPSPGEAIEKIRPIEIGLGIATRDENHELRQHCRDPANSPACSPGRRHVFVTPHIARYESGSMKNADAFVAVEIVIPEGSDNQAATRSAAELIVAAALDCPQPRPPFVFDVPAAGRSDRAPEGPESMCHSRNRPPNILRFS